MFAYLLHRKYSFRDFKRVGVAIYANGVENVQDIHKRVGQYPDFIHVDIVDQNFVPDADETKVYRMEVIRAFWPNREIHTHLMSKTPSQWLPEVIPYSDIIYLHSECDENIPDLLKEIRFHGKQRDSFNNENITRQSTINSGKSRCSPFADDPGTGSFWSKV